MAADDLVIARLHNVQLEQVAALGHGILERWQGILGAFLASSTVCTEDRKWTITFTEENTLVEVAPLLTTSAKRLQHAMS